MATFFATLLIFAVVMLGMAVGVLVRGQVLRGSCGGSGKSCECSPLAARDCRLRQAREAQATE